MKSFLRAKWLLVVLAGLVRPAPAPVITDIAMVGGTPWLTIQSEVGVTNRIQYVAALNQTNWVSLTNVVATGSPYTFSDVSASPTPRRFYRVAVLAPPNMVVIPGGSFIMGDTLAEGDITGDELPTHTVPVSVLYMDQYEVTKALWDHVYQWATNYGYSFDNAGCWHGGFNYSKGSNHPVHLINWYDVVKWCNARSEMEGRTPAYYTEAEQTTVYRGGRMDVQHEWVKWNTGYRLPTEAEWEKAARGGAGGHRFPWSDMDTISHSQANYNAATNLYAYDVSPTESYHPTYATGAIPYTSPVGSFAANGYGLHDMTGNVWEWCWDWYDYWYTNAAATQNDTRGPAFGPGRVVRGGGWSDNAWRCRVAYRQWGWMAFSREYVGFRTVLSPGQP